MDLDVGPEAHYTSMTASSKVVSHGHAMFHRVFERSVIRRIIYICQDDEACVEVIWVLCGGALCAAHVRILVHIVSASQLATASSSTDLSITVPCQSALPALRPPSLFSRAVRPVPSLARFVSGHYALPISLAPVFFFDAFHYCIPDPVFGTDSPLHVRTLRISCSLLLQSHQN